MMIEICDTSVRLQLSSSTVKKHKTVEVVRASDHPLDALYVRVSWTCPSGKRPLDILRFGWGTPWSSSRRAAGSSWVREVWASCLNCLHNQIKWQRIGGWISYCNIVLFVHIYGYLHSSRQPLSTM